MNIALIKDLKNESFKRKRTNLLEVNRTKQFFFIALSSILSLINLTMILLKTT